jgi:GNAT superfamily N-acetyltransferase
VTTTTGEVLRAADGRRVATFVRITGRTADWAEAIEPVDGVNPHDVAAAVLRELPGYIAEAPVDVCEALLRSGARPRRYAHVMNLDLTTHPPAAAWGSLVLPAGLRYAELGEPDLLRAAYLGAFWPASRGARPDAGPLDFEENFRSLTRGEALGPVLPSSGQIIDDGLGRGVAACVITDRDGSPWVGELFRDPASRYAGLGGALLRHCLWLAASHGVRSISLAVTVGNPAQQLYESVGFTVESTSRTVYVPPLAG